MKVWEIANIMFGKNTKAECKLVKKLLKKGVVTELCDDWSIIAEPNDIGYLIPNECLNQESK
jgi:hypothetical protein